MANVEKTKVCESNCEMSTCHFFFPGTKGTSSIWNGGFFPDISVYYTYIYLQSNPKLYNWRLHICEKWPIFDGLQQWHDLPDWLFDFVYCPPGNLLYCLWIILSDQNWSCCCCVCYKPVYFWSDSDFCQSHSDFYTILYWAKRFLYLWHYALYLYHWRSK